MEKTKILLLENKIRLELKLQGAEFVHFVDISNLTKAQNMNYPVAILMGITLSPEYLKKITETPDYVQLMIQNKEIHLDEFHLNELKTDRIADYLAKYLISKGYSAYSQSEDNIVKTGYYDKARQITPLPHKTVALLAGLGWIGKHDLLVTPEFGSAISMCTVLTNAPLGTVLHSILDPQCGECEICVDICKVKAIKGNTWGINTSRDELVDVKKCTPCLKCMVFCPRTQKYMKKGGYS